MKKKFIKDIIVPGATDLTEEQITETIQAYSKNASSYARMWSWNPAHREEIKDQQIIKFTHYSESGSKVLVAGAGTGRDLEILVDEGFECTALDVSEQMLNEAKSRGIRSKYIVHDFRTKLPFPSTSFDAVYCESALEHVPKKEAKFVLQEFYRVLVPRGILYIGAKKGEGEIYYRYDVGNKVNRRFYTTYDDVEFHQLLAQTDFSVIEFWIDDHFDRQTHRWLSAIVRRNS